MSVGGFREVEKALDDLEKRMYQRAYDAMDEIGHHLANDAKTHHEWQPVTGATDVSTVGGVYEATQEFIRVVLSAGMDYDVFLETARQGRWAWLHPTVTRNQAYIVRRLGEALSV